VRPRPLGVTVDDDQLTTVRRRATALRQQCAALAQEVAALASEVTELIERPTTTPLSVSVEQAAHLLGLSRSTIFSLLETGAIRSVKVGSRRLVPRQALEDFLAQRDQSLAR